MEAGSDLEDKLSRISVLWCAEKKHGRHLAVLKFIPSRAHSNALFSKEERSLFSNNL